MVVVAFYAGAVLGFVTFALLTVAAEATRTEERNR